MTLRFAIVLGVLGAACTAADRGEPRFEAGQRLMGEGRLAEAIVEFRGALAENDRWPEPRLKLAEAYEALGEPEQAYREYVRAADLMPADAAVQLKAVEHLLRAGQFVDAKTRAERLVAATPEDVAGRILLGDARAGLRDVEGAVREFNEAVRLDPTEPRAHLSLGRVWLAQGKSDAARSSFERAVRADERSVAARLALADFQWMQGDQSGAEASLKRAIEIDQTSEATNRALATLYMESGRAAAAEPHLRALVTSSQTPDARLRLSEYLTSYNRLDEARSVLAPLLEQPATTIIARGRLAEIEYTAGNHEAAHRMIDELLARAPNSASGQLAKARWLLDEGRPEDALDRAKGAIAANPRLAAGYYVRGVAEARTRQSGEAIASFNEVLRLNPQSADARIQLSTLHLSEHAIGSAVLLADEAMANAPTSIDGRYAQIRAWIAAGEVARAAAALAALGRRTPETATIHEFRGALYMRDGRLVHARQAYERALSLDPASRAALLGLVRLARTPADMRGVRVRLEQRPGGVAGNPELLLATARLALATGDREAAEQKLRQSIVADPLDVNNFALLARIYREDNRLAAARAEFDAIAARDPSDLPARSMAAVISHAMGDLADARRRYEDIVRTNPRVAVAANNLASIYADAGENLHEARRLAELAVQVLPGSPDVRDTLGWVYYQSAQYGKAVTALQQTVALAPRKADSQYRLGLAYSKSGDAERARAALETAVRLQPDLAEASEALRSLSDTGPALERTRVP